VSRPKQVAWSHCAGEDVQPTIVRGYYDLAAAGQLGRLLALVEGEGSSNHAGEAMRKRVGLVG
jgi:hypothetical protein